MTELVFMNSKAMKELAKLIEEQYGFADLRSLKYMFYKNHKGKIYAVHEDVANFELSALRIDSLGMYFMRINDFGEVRFSIEGSQVIGPLATKNVIDFDEVQIKLWMKGMPIPTDHPHSPFMIVRYRGNYVGCTKAKNEIFMNHVPKVRYILVD